LHSQLENLRRVYRHSVARDGDLALGAALGLPAGLATRYLLVGWRNTFFFFFFFFFFGRFSDFWPIL
jgi:hypothetical protein